MGNASLSFLKEVVMIEPSYYHWKVSHELIAKKMVEYALNYFFDIAGFAIMGLGAMANDPDIDVKIIPVGEDSLSCMSIKSMH